MAGNQFDWRESRMVPRDNAQVRSNRYFRYFKVLSIFLAAHAAADIAHGAAPDPPFVFEKSFIMSAVPPGPYSDYLAVDAHGGTLFATPQAAKAVAVINLKDGRVVKMIS